MLLLLFRDCMQKLAQSFVSLDSDLQFVCHSQLVYQTQLPYCRNLTIKKFCSYYFSIIVFRNWSKTCVFNILGIDSRFTINFVTGTVDILSVWNVNCQAVEKGVSEFVES
jgi:hypothetical protein